MKEEKHERKKYLTINSGSSSIKFKLFQDEEEILSGMCDAIGLQHSKFIIKTKQSNQLSNQEKILNIQNHEQGIKIILEKIVNQKQDINQITAIIHRVVHGGEQFRETIIITNEILKKIKELNNLAPLHNPVNIKGIEIMKKILPDKVNLAVFDTAFHSTIPQYAYLYGIPYEYYEKDLIRKYGFHGTSHKYVIQEALKKYPFAKKIISCHLGNGSSITACLDGKSIENSMGFTPLEGLIMGTRSGDLDPAIVLEIMKREKITIEEMNNILNKKSGLFGLSQFTSDMRKLHETENQENSKRAIETFCYRIKKYISSYIGILNGVDIIIFTGGIGENAYYIREKVLQNLDFIGIKIDKEANQKNKEEISDKDSKVKILIIPTNEELQMVREAKQILD